MNKGAIDMSAIFGFIQDIKKTNKDKISIERMQKWNRAYGRDGEEVSEGGEFGLGCCYEKLSADAALSDALFYSTCNIHLSEMEKSEADKYKYYWETIDRYADLSDFEPENPTASEIERLKKDSYEKA